MYSPGEGPVPFVYSAECYPLYIRDIGMSIATAVTWLFNALLTITWPPIKDSIGSAAFAVYAALNLIGFVFILLLVPETRNRTLEELNSVFEVPSRDQAMYGMRQLSWFFGKWIWGKGADGAPVLVVDGRSGERSGVSRDEGELECRLWESGPTSGGDRDFPSDISPLPVSKVA